ARCHHRADDVATDRPDRRKDQRAGVTMPPPALASRLPAIGCVALATVYGVAFLAAESQAAVGALLALAAAAIALAARAGLLETVRASIGANPATLHVPAPTALPLP